MGARAGCGWRWEGVQVEDGCYGECGENFLEGLLWGGRLSCGAVGKRQRGGLTLHTVITFTITLVTLFFSVNSTFSTFFQGVNKFFFSICW